MLQPDRLARAKGRWPGALLHATIHVAAGCLAVNIGLNRGVIAGIVALGLVHAAIDYVKTRRRRDTWVAFATDQVLHAVAVVAVAVGLGLSRAEIARAAGSIVQEPRMYLYLCAYVGVVFGGGYFVQKVTQPFLELLRADLKPGLPNAGRYIGWLERFLILTFVLAEQETAIGFLLGAKAIVRYPEIKEDSKGHFAEYFLIGTLTSVGLALFAGLVVRKLVTIIKQAAAMSAA